MAAPEIVMEMNDEELIDSEENLNLYDEEVSVGDAEVDFLESYVLSLDRMETTAQKYDVDTLDYWYWSLLNCQVKNNSSQFESLVHSVEENDFFMADPIQNLLFRQSIIEYSAATAEDVAHKLLDVVKDVKLDHAVDSSVGPSEATVHPTQLQLNTNNLLARTWTAVMNGTSSITDLYTPAAGVWLADKIKSKQLNETNVGSLLDLMEDEPPEFPFLLTALQMDFKNGTKFGDRKVHFKLPKTTLDLIGEKMPSLFDEEEYLFACCRKLRGVSDIDLMDDLEGLGQYLSDLVGFCKKHKVGEKHKSLQGLIMYNYLIYNEKNTSQPKKKGKKGGKGHR